MTVSPTLDERFREAAAAAGLLDVAYDLAETPIGTLLVATTERGLCRISYDPQPELAAESLAHTFGLRVLRATKPIDPVRRQLDEYFEGTPHDVRAADRPQPPGSVQPRRAQPARTRPLRTGDDLRRAGRRGHRPKAARAVGTVMNRNPVPIVLPCHRVVGANGSLVGYGGGLDRKEQLLKLEGALDNTLL